MRPSELRELLRSTFMAGYECGRTDEREDREMDPALPDNVVSLDARRDSMTRKQASV